MTGVDNTITGLWKFEGKKWMKKFSGVHFNPLVYECPSNDTLSNRFLAYFPQNFPQSFWITHLSPTVSLFALQTVQILSLSISQKEKKITSRLTKLDKVGAKSCSSPRFLFSSYKSATFLSQEKLLGDIELQCWEDCPKSCPLSGSNIPGLLWLESHSKNQQRSKNPLEWSKRFILSNGQFVAKGGETMGLQTENPLTHGFLLFCSCY